MQNKAPVQKTTTALDPERAQALLTTYGIPTPPQRIVTDLDPSAITAAASELEWPIALKAIAPTLVHKTERGGVHLGLRTIDDLTGSIAALRERFNDFTGVLLQQQLPAGVEMIIGCRRDPTFGPLVLVGLGGIWVEALDDVALRLAPVTPETAQAMIDELRGSAILDGMRGHPAVDRSALIDLIVRVGRLACEQPSLVELDLNPVIAGPTGVVAVDARIILTTPEAVEPTGPARSARREVVDRLLAPRSIAVVGASADRTKPGGRLVHYLHKHGYTGRLYPVNPTTSTILGQPCFPSITALPEVPDLVCIATPAETVDGLIAECGRHGVPASIVYAAGFGETGDQGQRREATIRATARAAGVAVCGPNTVGVVNTNVSTSMCAAFGMAFEIDRLPAGTIAFLTQSGALGGSLLSRACADGHGFSHWICTGNEVDLTLSDYFDALVESPTVRVIAVFMESLRDPQTFITAAQRARSLDKRVVVYKTGRSEAGQRAVQSHTGSLAGDDRAYDAAFKACGVTRVHDLQALVDAAVALAWQPLPSGRRVGVISASGGACSVIADECARNGLELPLLSDATQRRIAAIIPPFGTSQNPIDVTIEVNRNPAMIGQVTEILLAEDSIDAVVVLLTTNADPPALEVAKGVVAATREANKPVLVTRIGAEFLAPASLAHYHQHQIPLVPMPDRAVKVLRAMVDVANPA